MDVFLLQVSMDLLGAQSIINGDCSCIFPYMANTVLRNAMGHVREERDISSINTDTMAFSIPPSLRDTSPIANATPRNATGHSNGEV